jgi:uncharacterized protein
MRLGHALSTVAIALMSLAAGRVAAAEIEWRPWSPELFATARAEKRLVILDLEAVWCHWCHVMAAETYGNVGVSRLLADKFITVRADQDANPDLASRYGDWGWPATIIFAPDGRELAKLRGFVPPTRMASLLQAFVDDPTPGPSAAADDAIEPAATAILAPAARAELTNRFRKSYDRAHGGWQGLNKFVDTDSMSATLRLAETGDAEAAGMVKQTLDAARALIDPVWGGVFQYSETPDWRTPHYEKIMWYQASMLGHYAAAYALWHRPGDRAAGEAIAGYLARFLTGPDGTFYTSQDADVGPDMTGKAFYALDAGKRAALGRAPRIDQHVYARENGWAIGALAAYADATGDTDALARAERAARAMLATRRLDGGGFRHGEADRAGPYLADTLAMGQGLLALYAATGNRDWLAAAQEAGKFLASTFKDPAGGYRSSVTAEAGVGTLATPVRALDEQIATARFLNLLGRTTGDEALHAAAEHALRYAAAPAIVESGRPLPGLLLADGELAGDPSHVTIVGHKDDPLAQTLDAAARALPSTYARIDWWDKREGPLGNPDVTYPEFDSAAAFVCTNRICSLPAISAEELAATFVRLQRSPGHAGSQ